MKLLDRLLAMARPAAGDPIGEWRRLATLLLSEVRLYNIEALAEHADPSRLPRWLVKELTRSYRIYSKEAGDSETARQVFVSEAAGAFVAGDKAVITSALETAFGSPEPVRPS